MDGWTDRHAFGEVGHAVSTLVLRDPPAERRFVDPKSCQVLQSAAGASVYEGCWEEGGRPGWQLVLYSHPRVSIQEEFG